MDASKTPGTGTSFGPVRQIDAGVLSTGYVEAGPADGAAALAADVIALMDALHIEKAILAGFDRGARSAHVIAALWPDRCQALVSVSGYHL
jgi:pimeloyl-ACP methyl ester carboxylesterase